MKRWLPNLIARIFIGPPKDPADAGTATWEGLGAWAWCALRRHPLQAIAEPDADDKIRRGEVFYISGFSCACGARKEDVA